MTDSKLLRYNIDEKKFIVFDYEGELNLYYSTPFQLGFLVCDGKKIIETYDFYIKWPNLYVSDEVRKIANYNPKRMEKEGKDPKEVFTIFEQYVNNPEYHIVGANILSFDTILTYNCFKRLNLKHNWDFLKRSYDTNALFKGYKLNKKPDNDNLLSWQYNVNNTIRKNLRSSVSYIAKEFGIPFDESELHDGVNDCILTWKNFLELIKRIELI